MFCYASGNVAEVFYQEFWMKKFGHPTPKRTKVFSNSPQIHILDTGKMNRTALSADVQTTRRYVSKDGKERFAGTKELKSTQFL